LNMAGRIEGLNHLETSGIARSPKTL